MAESITELQQARDALKQNIEDVSENIKKLTGRDPDQGARLSTPRRVQLKRNSYGSPSIVKQPPIKRVSNERRRWGSSALSSQNNLDSGGEEEEKKKPAVHSSVVATGSPIVSLKRPILEDSQTKKRNQRMFGFLLGTLRQFKQDTKLKSEQESKREEKLQKVEEKVEKDKEDAIRERKELYQSRRDKQKELKKIEFKLEMAELTAELKTHYDQMKDFIQLKSTPRLFYKPCHLNKKTTKLLEESKQALQESLQQRLKEIEMCTEEDLFQAPRPQRNNRPLQGSSGKDPIIIDAAPSNRDLFAEDAEIEKREIEADKMKTQANDVLNEVDSKSVSVVEDVPMVVSETKEALKEEVLNVDNLESSDVVTRVVVNGENDDARKDIPIKPQDETITVQGDQDSRVVFSDTNYSVIDERVVELSSNDVNDTDIPVVDDSKDDANIYGDVEQENIVSLPDVND